MPNWTYNKLVVKGSTRTIKNFVAKHIVNGAFDFNTIIKMPESLNVSSGSITILAIEFYLSEINPANITKKYTSNEVVTSSAFKKLVALAKKCDYISSAPGTYNGITKDIVDRYPDLFDLGFKYVSNLRLYGCTTWYEWCRKYWGVKWNACDTRIVAPISSIGNRQSEVVISFDTPWAPPFPIINRLMKMYPKLHFKDSFDEEGGFFLGSYGTDGRKDIDTSDAEAVEKFLDSEGL